jgi:hypothetical protein
VLVPVELDDAGNILDGHHRVQAAQELGLEGWPQIVRVGLTEDEKLYHARKLNMARRQMTREQRREIIKLSLLDKPGMSDRWHAEQLGVDHKTVGSVRDDLQSKGDMGNFPTSTDSLGREFTRHKVAPQREPASTPSWQPSDIPQQTDEPPASTDNVPPTISIMPTAEHEAAFRAAGGAAAFGNMKIDVPDWVARQGDETAVPNAQGEQPVAGEPIVNRTNFTGNNQWFTPEQHISRPRARGGTSPH